MRPRHTMTALALLAALGAIAGCDDDDDDDDDRVDAGADGGRALPDADIADTVLGVAADDPDLSMFVSAANRANIASELTAAGPLTVFAPTNQAFAASGLTTADINATPRAELRQLLLYHVIEGEELQAAELSDGPVTSAADLTFFVTADGTAMINRGNTIEGGADVVETNIEASNGVIHTIDRVLLPPNLFMLATYGGYTTLVDSLNTAELADALAQNGTFTLFAPTNEAFAALPAVPTGAELANTLGYHVLAEEVLANAIVSGDLDRATTISPNLWEDLMTVLFSETDDVAAVNDIPLTLTNLMATNGIMHVIDNVLVPPNIVQMAGIADLTAFVDAAQAAAPLNATTTVVDALSGPGPFTVFIPTNQAFAAAGATLDTFDEAQIRDVLLYHVLDPTAFAVPQLAEDLPEQTTANLPTLLGPPVELDTTTDPFTVNDADIVETDIVVMNGVIHVIDQVLIPPGLGG